MSATTNPEPAAKAKRRYPRRKLRGPLVVWYSARVKYPKMHIVRYCEGLEHTPEEALAEKVYDDTSALALDDTVRPCRLCALESVFYSTIDIGERSASRNVFVSSTSQGSPDRPDVSTSSYRWTSATPSGEARLARIARRLGLPLARTTAGLVTWGWTNELGAKILVTNLRTVVRPGYDRDVDAATVECAWSLLNDLPPELAAARGDECVLDALETARMLVA